MTLGFWHGPRVRKVCKKAVNMGCMHSFDQNICFECLIPKRSCFYQCFVCRSTKTLTKTMAPVGDVEPSECEVHGRPLFHKFLVLGICRPTKIRRQLLWSIETEHKGKGMIMTVMMMHMLMMRKYWSCQGFVCRSTMKMMMMMMACILMMVAKRTSLHPPPHLLPTPPAPPSKPGKP